MLAALVYDNTICTFAQVGQGVCTGDNGGPLVVSNSLIGIVSWGSCGGGQPDVFVRISSHINWIIANTI